MEHTPETAKATIISVVRSIIAQKVEQKKEPAVAFLNEIKPHVPWSITDVIDILEQLVLEAEITKGRTINTDYFLIPGK